MDLYQEIIIDHAKTPRNFGCCDNPSHQQEGKNPLCGDQLQVSLVVEDHIIKEIKFDGEGCAISMASASLMTEAITGKTLDEVKLLFDDVHAMLTGHPEEIVLELGKLKVLSGVSEYPMRVKCASLAWHTLIAALEKQQACISTEGGEDD